MNFFVGPEQRNGNESELVLSGGSGGHLNHQIEVAVKIFRTVLTLHIVPPIANSELLSKINSEILCFILEGKTPTWLKIVPRGHKNDDCLLPSSHTWNTFCIFKCKSTIMST